MKKEKGLPTEEDLREFEMLQPMLRSIYDEIKELSKKKQDGLLNASKVRIVNRLLVKIKDILKNESTNELLDLLDSDSLPSNSDAILVIPQFTAAMRHFRDKYYDDQEEEWNIS
jgi:hypothetical protein